MNTNDRITYFAETDFRNQKKRFGIKAADRTKHVYVIGKTGMGKSTLLENMAVQDVQNGEGMAFIDPHGGTAERILEYIPRDRINDVIYFAPFDMEHPISFNVMEDVGYDKRHLVVSGLMSAFEKIWADAWSARMSYILSNTLFALLEYPDSTLLDINRMLVNKEYRKVVVDNITDPAVKSFWVDEFANYGDRYTKEATPAIQNKIGQFVSNPLVRNIIGQPKSSFDIRQIMDDRKILIMNLSKGRIGEGNTNLLGSILITKIYLSAMSRADIPGKELALKPNFYFYVDEFQSFANKSFADILSEARKYKLNLTIAHQYVEQMEEEVREAVFGNVGTMIVFRVGSFDAEIFEKEFAPEFIAEDIVNLGFAQIYLKLMIDGIGSRPFSAVTLPPIAVPDISYLDEVIKASQKNYGRERKGVERVVQERLTGVTNILEKSEKEKKGKIDVTARDGGIYKREERQAGQYKKDKNIGQGIRTDRREQGGSRRVPDRRESNSSARIGRREDEVGVKSKQNEHRLHSNTKQQEDRNRLKISQQNDQSHAEQVRAIPLEHLKRKETNDSMKSESGNKNELREALAGLLGGDMNMGSEKSVGVKREEKSEKGKSTQSEAIKDTGKRKDPTPPILEKDQLLEHATKPSEVPENILRDVLK